jgi:hypothetical protein
MNRILPILCLSLLFSTSGSSISIDQETFAQSIDRAAFVGEVKITSARPETFSVADGRSACGYVCRAEVLEPLKGSERQIEFFATDCHEDRSEDTFLLIAFPQVSEEERSRARKLVEQKTSPIKEELLCRINTRAAYYATPESLVRFERVASGRWLRVEAETLFATNEFQIQTVLSDGGEVRVVSWPEIRERIQGYLRTTQPR